MHKALAENAPDVGERWIVNGSPEGETSAPLVEGHARPRLLIVARDRYPPYRVDVTVLFSKYLSRHLRIEWLMRRDKRGGGAVERRGDEIFHVVAHGGVAGALDAVVRHASALLRVLRGHYDIVQCRDAIILSAAYALAARLAGVSFIYWMSFPIDESYVRNAREIARSGRFAQALPRFAIGWAGTFLLYRFTLKLARHVFAQSERMKEALAARGTAPHKVTAVPMGVDTAEFDAARVPPSDHPFYEGRRLILYVGTLSFERHMHVPLGGAIDVMAERPDTVVAVIGEATDEERAPIRRMFECAGLSDRLLLLDHMPLSEVLRHVRRADVCLSPVPATPLLAVGTATKLTEYLALGRRVVANRHPDQELVIAGAGMGILVEFVPEAFKAGILRALDLGEPSPSEVARALHWVRQNRDYSHLSAKAADAYKRTIK